MKKSAFTIFILLFTSFSLVSSSPLIAPSYALAPAPNHPYTPSPLPGNRVTSILTTDQGFYAGTSRGLFFVDRSEDFLDGRIPPSAPRVFVTKLAHGPEQTIAVGTSKGPGLLDKKGFHILPVISAPLQSAVSALTLVKTIPPSVFAGGAFGLVQFKDAEQFKTISLPEGMGNENILALASYGPDLYVAFDDQLQLFRTLRNEWIQLSAGKTYTQIAILNPGLCLALRLDGGIDEIKLPGGSRSNNRLQGWTPSFNVALPAEVGVASCFTIDVRNGGIDVWVGTVNGTVYRGVRESLRASAGNSEYEWTKIAEDKNTEVPVRSIGIAPDGVILVGTDGVGLRRLQTKKMTLAHSVVETWYLADRDEVSINVLAGQQEPSEDQKDESWALNIKSGMWIFYGIGLLFLVGVGILVRREMRGKKSK